jgi:hypothetical protein
LIESESLRAHKNEIVDEKLQILGKHADLEQKYEA